MTYNYVEKKANNLCRRMGNIGDTRMFKLYCKAYWELNDNEVELLVEKADKGRNKPAYLNWLLNKALSGEISVIPQPRC